MSVLPRSERATSGSPPGSAEPAASAAPPPGEAAAAPDQAAEREAALAELFGERHLELVRLAVLLGAEADAEDVVAEAFCELHRRWNRLRSPGAALPYLRAVVVNLVRMRVRHLQVVRRHPEWEPVESSRSAESEALLRDDQRAVVRALARLPRRQREALVLRYWMGLKEAEIAAAMGISQGAVKSHTSRAMAALTSQMEATT